MSMIPNLVESWQNSLINCATEAAAETGLVRRKRKVTGANLAQTLIFGWWSNPDASLEELCKTAAVVGLDIQPQGLDERFNAVTANFLKALLGRLVAVRLDGEPVDIGLLNRFARVYIEDSSVAALPEELTTVWQGCGGDGSASTVKMQTRLEMRTGQIDGPHLVDGRVHDCQAAEHHPPVMEKSLQLTDLGYWRLASWKEAYRAGTYRLSRLKAANIFHDGSAWWKIEGWVQQCQTDRFELDALLGKSDQLPVRIMGERVPPHVAEKRRSDLRRSAQKHGKPAPSPARLALCDWTVAVTNVPANMLSLDEALALLRYRWQIELLFKLWKSHGKLIQSRSNNPWRRLCEFYAKLCAMILQQWVFMATIWRFPDRSCVKSATIIRSFVLLIAVNLYDSSALARVFNLLRTTLARRGRINRSRKTPRPYQLFEQLARCNP